MRWQDISNTQLFNLKNLVKALSPSQILMDCTFLLLVQNLRQGRSVVSDMRWQLENRQDISQAVRACSLGFQIFINSQYHHHHVPENHHCQYAQANMIGAIHDDCHYWLLYHLQDDHHHIVAKCGMPRLMIDWCCPWWSPLLIILVYDYHHWSLIIIDYWALSLWPLSVCPG